MVVMEKAVLQPAFYALAAHGPGSPDTSPAGRAKAMASSKIVMH